MNHQDYLPTQTEVSNGRQFLQVGLCLYWVWGWTIILMYSAFHSLAIIIHYKGTVLINLNLNWMLSPPGLTGSDWFRLVQTGLYQTRLVFVHADFITVFPDGVHSQSIPRVTRLLAQRALMTKAWQKILLYWGKSSVQLSNSPLMWVSTCSLTVYLSLEL